MRLLLLTLLIQLTMGSGCHSGKKAGGTSPDSAVFVLNGQELNLDQEAGDRLLATVLGLFRESDDFYELLVTDGLLASIRADEEWLEVTLKQKRTIVTDKYGEIDVSNILIPLSGRYAGGDHLTFFSVAGGYSNTPLLNSTGLAELRSALGK